MKKLTIFGIIACVGLLFAPAAGIGAGPPAGLDVNVVNPVPLPVTGNVNVSTVYRFAGLSTATTTGNAGGIGGMNAICQADFDSTSARMCTTKEVQLSYNFPSVTFPAQVGSGWVLPVIAGAFSAGPSANNVQLIDAASFSYFIDPQRDVSLQISCVGYNLDSPGITGVTFIAGRPTAGAFQSNFPCSDPARVTCCIPAN